MRGRFGLAALTATFLGACNGLAPWQVPVPPNRPPSPPAETTERSAASLELERYYLAVQNDLLTQGLLRTDGGGPDSLFSAADLARNFETIAFYDEYSRPGTARNAGGELSRWQSPVRVMTHFGPSVTTRQRSVDGPLIERYTKRLARVTDHPITQVTTGANFHVFVAGEDDKDYIQDRLRTLLPDLSANQLRFFVDVPRPIYCLVVAFSGDGTNDYAQAVALIRAEHPDLVRQACIHEEMAQGLGLANDSLSARPSIFNDDDEFALLTTHDELLLKMLYDPRLIPGQSAEEARPVVEEIARGLLGGAS